MIGNLTKNNNKELKVNNLKNDLDKLFDDFFFFSPTSMFVNDWDPTLEIKEEKDVIIVKAEIPGLDEKDLDVRIENNTLILSGEKKEEKKEEKKNYVFSERKYGSFYRTVSLPEGINKNKAKASLKKGVLSIEIPREPGKEPKKIAVTVN